MSLLPENDKAASFHVPRVPPIRKLFTSDIQEDSHQEDSKSESFRVFLRIKPHHELNSATDCIKIVNSQTLVCKPPTNSKHKKAEKVEFSFSRIFGPKTTQEDLFNDSIVPFVETLLNGRDSLIFAYGTTNAGKTYTVQGSSSNPGIIPRTLHTLFSNIRPQKMTYKPLMGKNIQKMSNTEQQKQCALRQEIFETFRSTQTDFSEFGQFMLMLEESFVELTCGMPKCEVWISFVELYNETPHDLLTYPVKKLAVAEDKYHNFYVKDLRHLYVQSAEEAFKFYQYGRKNLCIASTKLNERSSRSHCIFTIQVINLEDPKAPTVSNLSICDLAGTERQTKAQNEGLRLKESGGINSSLFQLNRCLRTIRENQSKNLNQQIPYRYSNLTKLFRSALDDRTDEKILMIVNINPSPQLYDETQQVLKMCAIASKIKNKPIITKILPRSSRFSTFVYGQETVSLNDDDQADSSDYEDQDLSEGSVESEIENLKEQLAAKDLEAKNAQRHASELMKIYQNLQTNSTEHIESLEKNYYEQRNRYERLLKNQKEYYESKLHDLRTNSTCEQAPVSEFNNKLLEKDLLIAELRSKLEENEIRTSLSSSEIQLQKEVREKTAKIESLESLLQDAKAEFITLTEAWTSVSSKHAELEREFQDKCDLAEALEHELTCKQNIIEELESRIEHLEEVESKNTIVYEESLVALEKQRDQFKEELERTKVELAEVKAAAEKTKAELLNELRSKIEASDNRNSSELKLQKKVREQNAEIEELQLKLKQNETRASSEQKELSEKNAKIEELQLKLKESDHRAHCYELQLQEDVRSKIAKIEELQSKLNENEIRNSCESQLQKELSEKNSKIEELESKLKETESRTNTEIQFQRKELCDKNAIIEELELKLKEREVHAGVEIQFQKELSEKKAEIESLHSQLLETEKLILKMAEQERECQDKDQTRRYNTRRANRTPLSKSEKENKFFNLETPIDSGKKSKKTRAKEKNILIDVFDESMEMKKCEQENKENKFCNLASPLGSVKKPAKTRGKEKLLAPADVFDDSMESSIFRCASEKPTLTDNDRDTPFHGRKKKLFSTPTICDVDDLISLDSAEKNQDSSDSATNKSKAIREVTTPAQTIKSALRSKKKQY